MSYISKNSGRYTIDVINPVAGPISSRIINMTYRLPKQILILKGYRVEIDTAPNALASGVLYVDIQTQSGSTLLSYQNLIDNNANTLLFSLPLDNAQITNNNSLEKILNMSQDASPSLKITVYRNTSAGISLEPNLLRIYLDFETQVGAL